MSKHIKPKSKKKSKPKKEEITMSIVRKGSQFCVVGKSKTKSGKPRNFGCFGSKKEAAKRLGQVEGFKRRGK